jgi:hypothetical protein
MTIKTARALLSATWVAGSVPLLIIVALQTFNQVYGAGENWDKGALWIIPLILPVLGMVVGALSVGHNESDELKLSSVSSFWVTMILVVVYFIILYGSMIIGVSGASYRHNNWNFIISASSWILGNLQWVISIALTKFFIENIRVKQGALNNSDGIAAVPILATGGHSRDASTFS